MCVHAPDVDISLFLDEVIIFGIVVDWVFVPAFAFTAADDLFCTWSIVIGRIALVTL